MTKVINIPDFQIDDIVWTEDHLFAYYSKPGDTEAGEHQFVKISLSTFYDYLEVNDHLIQETASPYIGSPGCEDAVSILHIMPEEFRLLENSRTWPIIRQYLLEFHMPVPQLDGIAYAINAICSHFNKAI